MSSAKPIRVLIVDDHSDTLDWMKLLLESRGLLLRVFECLLRISIGSDRDRRPRRGSNGGDLDCWGT